MPSAPGTAGSRRGRHGNDDDDVPVVTGVPVSRPTAPPPTPFDVFTPMPKTDQDGTPPAEPVYRQTQQAQQAQPYPDFAGPRDTYVSPYADPNSPSYQGDGMSHNPTDSYANAANMGANGDSGTGYQDGDSTGGGIDAGLPRRVRQANLAPQLRASQTVSAPEAAAVPRASAASLTDMRNTLSAMQRGWQQGRSQTQRDTESNADGQ
jgi:hypothetical protein